MRSIYGRAPCHSGEASAGGNAKPAVKVLPEKAPPPAVNPWVKGEGAEDMPAVVADKVSADAGPLAAEVDSAHDGME